MKSSLLAALLLVVAPVLAQQMPALAQNATAPVGRQRLSLDQGWRFNLGDIPFPVIKGHDPSYQNAKAGVAWGAAAPDYDDTAWRQLDLPHDWAVEGPFDQNENLSQGYRPRGIGWYRRQFKVPDSERGRAFEVQFDGIATNATIWLNGTLVHRSWSGYASSYIDITPLVNYGGGVNTLAIRVDANAMEGWWYEGAGIYRHTWLVKRDAAHLKTDGVFANPVRSAQGAWTIPIEATVENSGKDTANLEVESTLLDPTGKTVAAQRAKVSVNALDEGVAKVTLPVTNPRLWSVDTPTLYSVKTTVLRDGKITDSVTTNCGFRTLRFDPDNGFFLNDLPLKIQGVCNHQDHAGVGVAVPDSLWEFRLRRLKEMGVNAYRCSHNPPSAEFLDECDRQGILVMDENRTFNTNPETMRQLDWLIRRDRNHPSVFMWSVFNEEPMQGTEQGYEMVRRMNAEVKKLDTTRPVTAAMSGGMFNNPSVWQAVDVVGFNYGQGGYDHFHKDHPTVPMTSSEDTSAFMVRGEYANDGNLHIRGSYDTEHAPWGYTHRESWKAIATRPFVAGTFIWTGFDYRGEPTPYQWPSAGSYFGCMDLCGFPKMAYYLHQAQWLPNKPILQLVPHWNWAGKEGQPIKVMALSNADTVDLILNGKSQGEKPVDPYEMVSWDVPYAPGKLEAIGKKGGKQVAHFSVETTGAPTTLQLIPDRKTLVGDGLDAIPVTVQSLDAQGRAVPTANVPVEFEVVGGGQIIGLGNGAPNSHEAEKGNKRSLFNGLAQVILQSKRGADGPLVLRANADGLKGAEISIDVKAAAMHPFVATFQPVFGVGGWKMSPVMATAPDPNMEVAANDQNSWQNVQTGNLQDFKQGHFAIYRANFKPYAAVQNGGGKLVFKNLAGKAQVWVDKKLVGQKDTFERASLSVAIPAGTGGRTVSVLIETRGEEQGGLGGDVTVEGGVSGTATGVASGPPLASIGAVGLQDATDVQTGWGTPGDNQTINGNPLSIGSKNFERGFTLHAPGEATFALDGKAKWFSFYTGIAGDMADNDGSVILSVEVDGKEAYKSPLLQKKEEPVFVVVPVDNAKKVRLVIGDGGNGNGGDHLVFGTPRLSAEAEKPKG